MTYIFNSLMAIFISGIFIVIAQLQSLPLRIFVVASGSMEPALSQGSLLLTVRQSDYQVGEVVTYRTRTTGQVVTHRIIANRNGYYQTQGDANPTADPILVRQNQIVGQVIFCLPGLGWPALWFNADLFQVSKTWALFTSLAQVQATSFRVAVAETSWMKNGTFDTNLDHWQTQGNVGWELMQAPDESQITGVASMATDEGANYATLTQVFDSPQTATHLSFWYQLDSSEDLLGFDQPTLEVQVNGQTVYSHDWAQNNHLTPTWRQVVIPITDLGPIHNLGFKIQNTGDDVHQVLVLIDTISVTATLPTDSPVPVFEVQTTFELHHNPDTTITIMIFSPLQADTSVLELATRFELRSATQPLEETTWVQASVVPVTAIETWVDHNQSLSAEPLLVTAMTFSAPPPEATWIGVRKSDATGNQSAVVSLVWSPNEPNSKLAEVKHF